MELLAVSIGIGLAVSLIFSELFGLVAGGMVVPGYLALYLDRPMPIILTVIAALVTFALVRLLSTIVILYGRRRTALMILVGYLVRMLIDAAILGAFHNPLGNGDGVHLIGYIIPGLIAIWIERQGLLETLAGLTTASVVVRLILVLVFSEALLT